MEVYFGDTKGLKALTEAVEDDDTIDLDEGKKDEEEVEEIDIVDDDTDDTIDIDGESNEEDGLDPSSGEIEEDDTGDEFGLDMDEDTEGSDGTGEDDDEGSGSISNFIDKLQNVDVNTKINREIKKALLTLLDTYKSEIINLDGMTTIDAETTTTFITPHYTTIKSSMGLLEVFLKERAPISNYVTNLVNYDNFRTILVDSIESINKGLKKNWGIK